jgi:F0F1-type ATP synthase epsilon subunit
MQLNVLALTSSEVLYEGPAKSVVLPGESGVFELLLFHKDIVSRLISGIMFIDQKSFHIRRGVARMQGSKVTVVVDTM